MNDPFDKAMSHFLAAMESTQKKEEKKVLRSDQISHDKSLKLIPVRKLLQRFKEMDLWVRNTDSFGHSPLHAPSTSPQKFEPYENESSPSWAPGVSVFFDHPAAVEIAIPNDPEKEGVVVIRCSTRHPNSNLFTKKFENMQDACIALSEFLGLNALRANSQNRDPDF